MPVSTAFDNYRRFYQGLFTDVDLIGISTGFLSRFGDPVNGSQTLYLFDTEIPEIEIIRGLKTIAAMVPRGAIGKFIDDPPEEDQSSTVFARAFPLGQKESNLTMEKINKRQPGEPLFVAEADQAGVRRRRTRLLAVNKHISLTRQLFGLMELLASLSVMEGKMPAILGTTNPDLVFDFHRNPDNTKTVTIGWNQATPTIMADIDESCDAVIENGKVNPDMLTIGEDSWEFFLDDEKIQKRLDLRRFEGSMISKDLAIPERFRRFTGNGGMELRGKLTTDKGRELWLFSYPQFYQAPNGDVTKFMPTDQYLVEWSGARGDRIFGPGEVLDPTRLDDMWMEDRFGFTSGEALLPENTPNGDLFDPKMIHFNAYESLDKKSITIQDQTAPIFITNHTDARAVGKGLIT